MLQLKLFISFVLVIALSACSSSDDSNSSGQTGGGTDSVAARSSPLPANDPDCPTGGVLVETGIDENSNGVLDAAEVDQSEKVCNGANGLQSLILLSDEPIGPNCPFGGVRVDTGIDTDGNGILDAGEITDTNFVCNAGRDSLFEAKEKLKAFDPEAQDSFGTAVAISGDYAVVGAVFEDPDALDKAGAAYIFRRTGTNTWDAGVKIVAPDQESDDRFGISVAISGDYVIVGAQLEDPDLGSGNINNAGAAYIFHRTGTNTWDTGKKVTALDAQDNDLFGFSVSISGDYAIVGALQEDPNDGLGPISNAGAAYIFQRTGLNPNPNVWDAGTKITSLDREIGGNFGASVAISGDYALVGAQAEDPNGTTSAGAAYIFQRTGNNLWNSVTKITQTTLIGSSGFGGAVAISGNYALVGSSFEFNADAGNFPGAAYVFLRTGSNTWDTGIKIIPPDSESNDQFGESVSISGNTVIVGAFIEDPDGVNDAGAAYVFQRTDNNAWDGGTKIIATDAEALDFFGVSVAISGSTAIVGASGEDLDGTPAKNNAGSAYIVR